MKTAQAQQLPRVNSVQGKRLKEVGFDWECDAFYNHLENPLENRCSNYNAAKEDFILCSAPTVAHALQWIRVEKDIVCHVITQMKHFRLEYRWLYRLNYAQVKSGSVYANYNDAESALLDALLDVLEKEKKQ
jgi:hypothetical protein